MFSSCKEETFDDGFHFYWHLVDILLNWHGLTKFPLNIALPNKLFVIFHQY